VSAPLHGTTVIELAGIGPAPFAGMMLADMGADVIRVDRIGIEALPGDFANRGKRSIRIDLKTDVGAEIVGRLVARADVLIEGFRPGVAERLGVGPDSCLATNPALVYGRVTGWGQDGPLAPSAGHDIDYIAVAGALGHIGRAGDKPTPPLNLVGDFGGGGMLLVTGVLAALLAARATGEGQVVDAAMVDGAALQMTMIHDLASRGWWSDDRGANLLDTGAPFYDTYETADGGYLAVGALEPAFFAVLIDRLGWDPASVEQMDRSSWPAMAARFTESFKARPLGEWLDVFEGSDACVAPILTMSEASEHPHNQHRSTFLNRDGSPMPAPAPRFSSHQASAPGPTVPAGTDTAEVLGGVGFTDDEVGRLRDAGIVQ
jgi:alpha-methylacyl-CoA racemase